jgi:hypothetical protein
MAKGQLRALSVVALAAGALQASSSASAGSVMEAASVAAMSAAVQQKLNPMHFDDLLPTSTPLGESCSRSAERGDEYGFIEFC